MPEGHSIHRLARQFNDVFVGASVQVTSPQGRFSAGAALLTGHRITGAYAHGKHLFIDFENELTLNVHLGIYGAWTFGGDEHFAGASSIGAPRKIGEREVPRDASAPETPTAGYDGPPEPKATVRARVVSEHGWADLVGPTVCRTLTQQEVAAVRAKLGPDPLNQDANPHAFYAAARKTARPIGVVLMDQKMISGVGNIFRAESLWRQEIDPLRPAKELTDAELENLWVDNKHLLEIGVRVGRIITTEPADRPGIPEDEAWPEHANYVYMHQGQPCLRCATTIRVEEVAGRKLYWCPGCQR
ncbi:Fpg/Nei family DNA glycosylase [Rothia sp. ZJ1223]|uniref:Fpg/Nei family DNA glycosylase n=1 Tax=Rothia sp. ZJ1223 TaxID=2811098 RepID=UPI0019599FDA|nr:Fpg/Nei family DNA glycosylase [Rothia sp. ZJ1223]MBM7050869.1 Fpg/Nei family DNA glycosylase [Rothia sp. ZJ1223]